MTEKFHQRTARKPTGVGAGVYPLRVIGWGKVCTLGVLPSRDETSWRMKKVQTIKI